MKLLIDECVLSKTARLLKEAGFSVVTIQELGKASATNGTVIQIAKENTAVIITNDLDFADVHLRPSHKGIILLRPRIETPEAINEVNTVLLRVLKELPPMEIERSLIIVDRNKYRIKK